MAPNTDGVWFSDDQGGTFQKWMQFAEVTQPVMCAQPEAQAVCAAAWYDFDIELHPRLPDAGVDAGTSTDDAALPPVADAADPPLAATDASTPDAPDAAPPISRKRSSSCQSLAAPPGGSAALWGTWLALATLVTRAWRRR